MFLGLTVISLRQTPLASFLLSLASFESPVFCVPMVERERECVCVCVCVCVLLSVVSNSSQGLCFYGSVCVCMCMRACVCTALSVMSTPVDCSSSVGEVFQARILEQVAFSFFRESSLPRDQTHVSCI